ncbi:hypothetical protein PX668_01475 [Acinetobacter soli]|nr:hypothetical protein [Acinetobacter soli]WEI14012.1 hypothetical protein PX667_08625 [Acinetobacter soli]WEI14018.1 hypothetical protein PX667_08660 [Acinetobacter soli]WEI14025.1 hypothetical protein PX667_08700 [Acinetobacter soli]WEI15675.1 hypothetical protein PX668_01475 [Acinetobacter soli]
MLFHSSTANRSKNIAQCFVSVLLCLTIFFNSITVANAGTIGGWTYSNPISKGASAVISATKNVVINGKDFIKTGSATITPTAAQVAKTFGKTAGALALTVAIEQMLGAVDWVMDPDNNSITYTKKSSYDDASNQYYYNAYANRIDAYGSTQLEAAQNYCKSIGGSFDSWSSLNTIAFCKDPRVSVQIYRVDNPNYNPTSTTPDNQPKSLPLSTVATRVIDNAKTGEPKAQSAILQAATDILAEAETDSTKARPITNQLEQSAETKPADAVDALKQNTGTAKTTNPDGTVAESEFEIPVACTWMPTICEAASVVTHQTKVWAQDIADYFKEEPQEQEDNTVDIDQSIPEITNKPRVSIGADQCPSVPMNFDLGIVSIPIDLSPIWLCEIAQGVKPFFIALGFYFASNIVGRRQQ